MKKLNQMGLRYKVGQCIKTKVIYKNPIYLQKPTTPLIKKMGYRGRSHDVPPTKWNQAVLCCFDENTGYALTMIPVKTMMTSRSMKENDSFGSTNVHQSSTQMLC